MKHDNVFEWIYQERRKLVTWTEFLGVLVRVVEDVALSTAITRGWNVSSGGNGGANASDSYSSSLPPLHSLASNPLTTVATFAAVLQDMLAANMLAAAAASSGETKKRKRCLFADKAVHPLLQLDRNGSTCLNWAGGCNNLDLVHYIMQHLPVDASARQLDEKNEGRKRDGKTFLHFAARNGCTKLLKTILSNYAKYAAVLQLDLACPVNDLVTNDNTTLLMLACYGGHVGTVKLLVETFKADVHLKNDWGCSCAHFVGISGASDYAQCSSLVGFLKREGVDFTKAQSNGHTPLHKACFKGNSAIVRALHSNMSQQQRETVGKVRDNDKKRAGELWASNDAAMKEWLQEVGWL
jgi:ankyrin repeat protein